MKPIIDLTNESSVTTNENTVRLLFGAIEATLSEENIELKCEVSVFFCENEEIRALNRDYRAKDRETDVLSFPIYESREELFREASENPLAESFALGDVIVAPLVVKAAAVEIGDPFEYHLCRMAVHSVLHLLGYDHETSEEDEREMLTKQEAILERYWKEQSDL